MRILITGGAGFIGSHMADRLIAEGHQVVAMDNLVTGDLANIAHHRSNPNFEFIHHDVSNHIHVRGDLDWVLHFASPASPIDYLQLPIQTLKVGALGTHNTLGSGEGQGREVPSYLDLGSLRRPACASTTRRLLGQRQPDRPARGVTTRPSVTPKR